MRKAEDWKTKEYELSNVSLSLSTSNVASMATMDTWTSPPPPSWEIDATMELDQLSREHLEHTSEAETVQSTHAAHSTHPADVQWEELANLELEMFTKEVEVEGDLVNGKEMMFYLENTDILAKRMVSATPVVEPYLPELEAGYGLGEGSAKRMVSAIPVVEPHSPESEPRDVLVEGNAKEDIDVYYNEKKRGHDDDGSW